MEEFLPHECDLSVPTFKPLEHLFPIKVEGVVLDGAPRLEANPLESLPGKNSGCLSFDPAEAETACEKFVLLDKEQVQVPARRTDLLIRFVAIPSPVFSTPIMPILNILSIPIWS